ncbi:MAG: amidophosphoribosyltransferase [Lentisphaeraceae bacterium]|nr:amidophosphoribosyltransferase [Lentisphaeraceae bacterium]
MKPKDECGVAAVYALKNGKPDLDRDMSSYIPLMLQDMQNRGELSAGITTFDPKRPHILRNYKALGQVKEAFSIDAHNAKEIEHVMSGCAAIGHVRYATCGKDDVNYAQPFERVHGRLFKWFSFCFNGNIANHNELTKMLVENKGYHISLDSDTEIFMHFLSREIAICEEQHKEIDYKHIFNKLAQQLDGAYTIAFIDARGKLIVARDPHGFKPLSYAITEDAVYLASESVAIWNRGIGNIKTLEPGCMIQVDETGVKVDRYIESEKTSHCFFEWIYFSNVASTIDDRNVYEARARAGEILARSEDQEIDENTIVVSVPDTAKACGDAMGFALGAKVVEGLFRNRYVGRTFIKSNNRSAIVQQKFTPLPSVLKGKKVLLVEDSLVRGTTLRHIIKDMKERGEVGEIHLRIACPPILSPCFYGIDMSTLNELFARTHIDIDETNSNLPKEVLDAMAHELGANSLRYLSIDDVPEALDLPKEDLCTACVNSDYPTEQGKKLIKVAREKAKSGDTGRTY